MRFEAAPHTAALALRGNGALEAAQKSIDAVVAPVRSVVAQVVVAARGKDRALAALDPASDAAEILSRRRRRLTAAASAALASTMLSATNRRARTSVDLRPRVTCSTRGHDRRKLRGSPAKGFATSSPRGRQAPSGRPRISHGPGLEPVQPAALERAGREALVANFARPMPAPQTSTVVVEGSRRRARGRFVAFTASRLSECRRRPGQAPAVVDAVAGPRRRSASDVSKSRGSTTARRGRGSARPVLRDHRRG